MKDLFELAKHTGLDFAVATEEKDGLQKDSKPVMICDNCRNYQSIEKLAQSHDLTIVRLCKKHEDTLWINKGDMQGEYLPTLVLFGDGYEEYNKISEADYCKKNVLTELAKIKALDFDQLVQIIEKHAIIYSEIDYMPEGHTVITRNGHFSTTIDKECLSWNTDKYAWSIGLINK